jgi:hypothetical protein
MFTKKKVDSGFECKDGSFLFEHTMVSKTPMGLIIRPDYVHKMDDVTPLASDGEKEEASKFLGLQAESGLMNDMHERGVAIKEIANTFNTIHGKVIYRIDMYRKKHHMPPRKIRRRLNPEEFIELTERVRELKIQKLSAPVIAEKLDIGVKTVYAIVHRLQHENDE